jgi:ABC-type transport system involved in multi-copper enzyme maturation permease subunit
MQINPIVKKDVRVQARSMRICWGLFAYEAIMALVFFFALFLIQQASAYANNNIYSSIIALYPVLALTQIIILGVVVPIRTASSISGEKERQTFDIMMTTSMTPLSIIAGKVGTAMIQSLFFVIAGMPIMSLAFVVGGISWSYLFWFLGIAVLMSIFSASIGIFCSSMCKRSITAVIMSYGIYVVFFLLTAIPNVITEVLGYASGGIFYASFGLYLFNPAVYLAEFFVWTMTGTSVLYDMMNLSMSVTFSAVDQTAVHGAWMLVSTVLFLLISLLFLGIAAKRISPVSRKQARKLAKAGEKVNVNG